MSIGFALTGIVVLTGITSPPRLAHDAPECTFAPSLQVTHPPSSAAIANGVLPHSNAKLVAKAVNLFMAIPYKWSGVIGGKQPKLCRLESMQYRQRRQQASGSFPFR